jgi:hypothetical protein
MSTRFNVRASKTKPPTSEAEEIGLSKRPYQVVRCAMNALVEFPADMARV